MHQYLYANFACYEREKEFLGSGNYDEYVLFDKKFRECIEPALVNPMGAGVLNKKILEPLG